MTPRTLSCALQIAVILALALVGLLLVRQSASEATPRNAPTSSAQSGAPSGARQVGVGIETRPLQRPGGSGLGRADVSAEARRERDLSRRQLVPKLLSEPAGAPLSSVTRQGILAYADPSHGPRYLATPFPVGSRVEVCGPAACLERTTNDAGPERWLQKPPHNRIGDVSAVDFPVLCGVPISAGLCPGSITVIERPSVTPPATDGGTE